MERWKRFDRHTQETEETRGLTGWMDGHIKGSVKKHTHTNTNTKHTHSLTHTRMHTHTHTHTGSSYKFSLCTYMYIYKYVQCTCIHVQLYTLSTFSMVTEYCFSALPTYINRENKTISPQTNKKTNKQKHWSLRGYKCLRVLLFLQCEWRGKRKIKYSWLFNLAMLLSIKLYYQKTQNLVRIKSITKKTLQIFVYLKFVA